MPDFRSDTVTQPTPAMREAMFTAPLGDDVFADDPSVNALQEHAAKLLGVDLVHFGVLVVLNMMIGLITPPLGMLLFVTKALTGIPIGEMMKEGWPFLAMLLLLLLLLAMTFFPQIVLWLPQTMGYKTM